MSSTVEHSADAIALDRFQHVLSAGDLDACLSGLRRWTMARQTRASLYCRLGEALFYRGDREAAVGCARGAFELDAEAEPIADFCAWLFSNCERHAEAATAYERLIEMRPGWAAGHRHASGSFAAVGERDRAIFHALRASELEPGSFEFAVNAGTLLEAESRWEEAIEQFNRAALIEPRNPEPWRRQSACSLALGRPEKALDLAMRAAALAPGDRLSGVHAAELLLRAGRLDEAAATVAATLHTHPRDDIAWRLLAEIETRRRRPQQALTAIERALDAAPEITEYHLYRGNLLYRLGRFDAAAGAFENAATLDPANVEAKRSQLTVYLDGGRLREAVAIGGELIRTAPDNEEYAQAVAQVLGRRFEALGADCTVLTPGITRPPRTPRPTPGPLAAARTQWRVVRALIIRETRTRFGDATLGYGWALLEPMLHILLLSLVFAVMMRGRPPIGGQFFIFYYTGIIPYHLFVHTSSSMTHAVTGNAPLLQLPLVRTFDVLIARGLLELVTDLLVAAVMLAGFLAAGIGRLPDDCLDLAASLAVIWLFGCGVGFANAVATALFRSWDKLWAQLTRLLYFCSGIFYVPGMMPDRVRDILAWNPMLHAVDWFRSGFFAEYQPHWLDRRYLLIVAALALVGGLALERALRRRLYEPS
ncbi:MAG TPA: tetratricopeptide repeat protein [Stellaceae bacterium]